MSKKVIISGRVEGREGYSLRELARAWELPENEAKELANEWIEEGYMIDHYDEERRVMLYYHTIKGDRECEEDRREAKEVHNTSWWEKRVRDLDPNVRIRK